MNDGLKAAVERNNELLEHQIERMDRQRKTIIVLTISISAVLIMLVLGFILYLKQTNFLFWIIHSYKSAGCV